MQLISFGRSTRAQTALVFMVTIAALAILVYIAAYWTWQWLAPRPAVRMTVVAPVSYPVAPADELFGHPQQKTATPSTKPTTLNLLGIAAAPNGQGGYAVMQVEPGVKVAVREGQSFGTGLKLVRVATDHVILERGGVPETLTWPQKNAALQAPATRMNK